MARIKISAKCQDCGKVPINDNERSNKNWNVVSTTCIFCGGKVKLVFDEKEGES